jgi:type IV secretion system protein VirB8
MKEKLTKQELADLRMSHSWYTDRYFISLVQRNFLFIFCLACFTALIASLLVIKVMIEKNSIEPYIIEVSDSSLIPTSVSTQSIKSYSDANPLVIEHFLTQYVKKRETYDPLSYSYDYNVVVKTLSSDQVYGQFLASMRDEKMSPIMLIGKNGRIDTVIKQVVPKIKNNTFIFRISKVPSGQGADKGPKNYQVTMKYDFNTSGMSYEDSMINPLGIKINNYEILDERSLSD